MGFRGCGFGRGEEGRRCMMGDGILFGGGWAWWWYLRRLEGASCT